MNYRDILEEETQVDEGVKRRWGKAESALRYAGAEMDRFGAEASATESSMIRAGQQSMNHWASLSPWTLSVYRAERDIIKYEEIYRRAYDSMSPLRNGLTPYFKFYNHHRRLLRQDATPWLFLALYTAG